MNNQELKTYEAQVKQRLAEAFGMSEEAANKVVDMVASFHTTRGGALYRIDDYLWNNNLVK